jgi:uncharacterized SAM-binding protein YcdF (DUF218 family)
MDALVWFGRVYLVPGSPMFLVLGLAIGLVLATREGTARLGRVVLWTLLVAYLALSTSVVSGALSRMLSTSTPVTSPDTVRQSAAIVLIGCGTLTAGSRDEQVNFPGTETATNISEAVRLYKLAGGHSVIATGGMPPLGANLVPESEVMRDYLVRMGVQPSHVQLESKSINTLQQARNVASMLPRGAKVVLVTVPTHMPRTAAFFRKEGFEVTEAVSGLVEDDTDPSRAPSAWDAFIPNRYALRGSERAMYEVVGLAYYWVRGDFR